MSMIVIDKTIKQANILVIDDEMLNLIILEELFEDKGFHNVTYESSPKKAIQLYQKHVYHLVLLDISMPDIDGFGVLAAFNDIALSLPPPVLILTSLNNKDTKLRGLREGAKDFLTKPFDHDEVLCRAENLIELHLSKHALNDSNQLLEQKVMERTHELEAAKIEIVNRLAAAADYRDTETSAHTVRVGLFSEYIAQTLGLEPKYCDILRQAAPMHDIGKIGIPDSILLKPGKLTTAEREIMQQHPLIGADLLKDSSSAVLKEAHIISHYHHERWDGNGYPCGLKGDAIPLSARIVILADIFDALTNHRPYKTPWPLDKVFDYLSAESGKIFDPTLLALFLEHWNDICAIKTSIHDA